MTIPPFEHGDLVEIPINISILFVILRVNSSRPEQHAKPLLVDCVHEQF